VAGEYVDFARTLKVRLDELFEAELLKTFSTKFIVTTKSLEQSFLACTRFR